LATQNHLIEILAASDRRRLLAVCDTVDLVLGQVVCQPATSTQQSAAPFPAPMPSGSFTR